MINKILICKIGFIAVVSFLTTIHLVAADRYSVASGNWNSTATWSATSGGASGASVPVVGDNVFIEGGYTVTVNIASACTNLSIASGSALNVGGFNFTVNGTTTIDGTLSFTNTPGTKTFIGLVTVNSSGIWNNNIVNAAIIFRGGISNSGTFNSGTGIYTFSTSNQALTGILSIPSVTVTGVTLTNNGTLTVGTALGGTGRLTQGINSTLNLGGTSAITTLTASNTGNTVNFSGTSQTVNVSSYYNLTISGSGNKTMAGDITVGGTLNLSAGTFVIGTRILTLNGPPIAGTPDNLLTVATSSLSFGGSSSGVFIPGSVANLNNLTINNASGVTMNSNITLAAGGVLTLTSGIVQAGTYILKITNTNPASALLWSPGSFVNVSTGSVERTLTANLSGTANNYMFPVGEGGIFKGLNLIDVNTGVTGPVLRASVSATGALTGDGTTISSVDPRYWSLLNLNGGNLTSAEVELYEGGLIGSKTIGMSSAVAGNYSSIGATTNPSSIVSSTVLNPGPYFCIGNIIPYTYYSYQTGNWNTATTWTSDPSGTLQIGNTTPGKADKVVVLSGRTISLTGDIAAQSLDITIEAGGFLDQNIYKFTNGINSLSGQGTFKTASVNFPVSASNTFVNAGGGTVEYNNSSNYTLPASQTTYNNLTINSSGVIGTQLINLTLNGNLYVKNGTFRINDNTSIAKLSLTINGNVIVDIGAFITVGNGVTNTAIGGTGGTPPFLNYYLNFHRVIIKGNFTNNGTVRFTNLPYPIYNAFPPTVAGATTGAASVYFQGASDNVLTCNGITNFYNLIIDKGIDQTYKLTINSTNYSNFRLFGANILPTDGAVTSNPNLRKALWIRTGTLLLQGSLIIPSLSEGVAANADYYIPFNGALIMNGIDLVVLASADDYREINTAYSVAAPDNATIGITAGGFSALDIFGKLQINNGFLSTRESGGLITSSVASGQLIINGGTVDAKQFLSANGSAQYTQTGGTFLLRGRFQRSPVSYATIANLSDVSAATLNTARAINGTNSGYGSFNLENSNNIFSMSGGTIRIYDVCGIAAAEQEAFDVKSSTANINVTGGNLEIAPVTGSVLADPANYSIFTNAAINNFSLNRTSGTSAVKLNTALVVLNDFSLISGDFNSNNFDLTVGGNLLFQNTSTYIPGTNTTIANGSANQLFTVNIPGAMSLNKFTVDKPSGMSLEFAGSQKTINVTDNFRLVLGTLKDNGNTINVSKDVFNSGLHTGSGKIVLNGTVAQAIDGNGIFNNIELNNIAAEASPVSLAANMTITGVLTFSQNKLFNIGIYNLTLNSSASILNGGLLRYIQTAGNAGDGGLTRVYSSPDAFTFPLGAPTLAPVRPVKYTPVSIGFSTAPSGYGSITVIPVGYEHPATTVNGQSLSYFWRVKSSGFSGVAPNSVTHSFVYDQSDVVGTEASYIPSLYNRTNFTWYNGANTNPPINTAINTITDWTVPTNSTNFLDADYTAGDASFGAPVTFYSIANSAWNLNTTWSYTSGGPAVPAGAVQGVNFPGPNSIVIIENNHNVNLTANQSCASLQIATGSTLDIYTYTGSVFSLVQSNPSGNNGLFRLTTAAGSPKIFSFPTLSDFSDFNNNHGTTEYYDIDGTVGAEYILPANVTSYGNLVLTAKGGDNLILPNNSYTTIKGDLTIAGDNPNAWSTMSWLTIGVYSPVVEKTVHVTGNMFINNGTFLFLDDQAPQHLIVDGDVTIAPGAVFDVYNGYPVNNGTSVRLNSFEIGGSLINNSNLNPSARFITGNNYVNLLFSGNTNASVTSTGGAVPNTVFNNVTINKGSSQTTTITFNIAGNLSTPSDKWLTLQNGTLIYNRTGNFTISQGTDFRIPRTAALILNTPSNVFIANSATNNKTLFLDGKLTLMNGSGNLYIGPVNNVNNNADIEYSGSGASVLDIQAGNFFINGQIRRPVASSNSILTYRQSGGNVYIRGNNALVANAKLEILNDPSEFTMSGGTLVIIKGGGTTYGDLYLRPTVSSVTGGTIIFTQSPASGPVIDAVQTYQLDANIPLNNLTITGKTAATARDVTVSLMVSPLVLNGSLTLSNINSIFNSVNKNVTINGNMINNGTYSYGTNLTTFSGAVQSVTGTSVTNFYDLSVSPATSLTVNNDFTINQNLTLSSGNLALAAKKANVHGDFTNNGSFTSDNSTGGISLSGASLQQITGTGAYGRLILNNASGARVNNDIDLKEDLVLTQGVLDINKNLLTLSQNSSISGASFNMNKMIRSDGVPFSLGVRKFFTTTSPQDFTFPVGTAGKYTPAQLHITSSSTVGYLNINPINAAHPSVTDPMNALNYYWQMESAGLSGFTADVLLQYIAGDVKGAESNYVAARLELPGNYWYKAPPGAATDNVDEVNHQITFKFTGSSNLSGEYTAGDDATIPGEIPTYQSNKDGNWTDQTIWTPLGSSPPCPAGGPNGSNVIISNIVTLNISGLLAYRTTINGTLRVISPTSGHNLGLIDGSGKIYVEGGNLPAGNYTTFVECSGNGTFEYGGTGSYTIIATQFNNIPNLFLTGTGSRILPNKDITICKRLVIDGPTLDNSINNKRLFILGSMERYNMGAFISGSGVAPLATVSFAGSSVQTVGGPAGDFTGPNSFNNFEINNPSGLIIGNNGQIEINNNLLLTNGIILTSSTNKLTLNNTASTSVFPAGGSATSFINGPLIKQIINGDNFLYPIGKGTTKSHNFTLTSSSGSNLFWTVEYFTPNPTYASLTAPLQASNTKEYWSVSTTMGTTACVKIGWDPTSDLTPAMTMNGLPDMRVAEYNAGSWNELTSTPSGDNNNGDVQTTNNVNISGTPTNYTTASVTPTLPRASLAPSGPVCGTTGIPVSIASFNPITLNYTLDYSFDGVAQPPVIISSLPYVLPTTVPGSYSLTGFKYNNSTLTGVVDVTPINVYALPTTADAGPDQSLCGLSGTTLAGNNPAPNTGLWTIVSGIGGTFVNSTLYNSVFTGVLGVSYTLRWTITNFSCSSSDDVVISFPVVAARPSGFTSAPTPVCQESTGNIYTVPNVPGNTYNWSYSGTGATITGSGNSVTIDFSSSATTGTLSVTATNSCGSSPARTVDITVTPLPVATFNYAGSPYCPTASNPIPTFSGGGIAGTFSSTAGLVFVSTATGQVNLAASTPGTYVVTNTIAAAGGCGVVIANSPITISSDQQWTGTIDSDWNTPGNWSCGYIPTPITSLQIPSTANQPLLSSGAFGTVNNLVIDPGATLTVTGNKITISGTITNNGSFTATDAIVEMNGSAGQSINAGIFIANTIKDLIINNPAGVTILGPLNVSDMLKVQNGNLASNGNLTLLSTAAQTALIDGSGTGTVTGNVTMQRYLPSGFGYKYFSSPFQNATVNEFADDMTLGAYTFYKYDENRTGSGWVSYNNPTTNPLIPLQGYALNFGSGSSPNTVDVSGVVNNGNLSVTLYNHQNTYTDGFNLVGNPYPSPIDWAAASGWTKTNIDNALYFFKASTSDQYGGSYISYVNGISTGGTNLNIIPSMQGFFVHVSPGSGTLAMTNSVRIVNFAQPFVSKKGTLSAIPLIRMTATFSDNLALPDPVVIYFDEKATPDFDNQLDALKLLNTDLAAPNLYSVAPDGKILSINALPTITGDLCTVPLGLKLNRTGTGTVVFKITDIDEVLTEYNIYLTDIVAGTEQDLMNGKEYIVSLAQGTYNSRFFLNLSNLTTGIPDNNLKPEVFIIYSSDGILKAEIYGLQGKSGTLNIYNLSGQIVFTDEIYTVGYHEFNPGLKDGIYIVNFTSGTFRISKKLFIQHR
jgi:hypothetical protein